MEVEYGWVTLTTISLGIYYRVELVATRVRVELILQRLVRSLFDSRLIPTYYSPVLYFTFSDPASGSITSPRHTAAKQSITLAQPPAYDDEDIGVGREGAAEDPFGGMYLQDDPQPGLDLNLDEIDRPEGLDELFQDGGAMANLGPGRSSSQLGHDQFDFNDDNFQFPEDDPIPQ